MVDGLRFFNDKDIDDINSMTVKEYDIYMEASRLRELDQLNLVHEAAMANQSAKATDKKGKPLYRTYKDFFDFDKKERAIRKAFNGEAAAEPVLNEKQQAKMNFANRYREAMKGNK